ncbi:MAG: NAD(P)-dependent oxidoreductase [Chloroflexota bacterium]|nr:NAD(P)-dependent oxidoreductase [Chloroflexota bacterium]
MAESGNPLSVLVTGGAVGVGLATARALLKRGHKVAATAPDATGALAIRQAGALPVYPNLGRASEVLSILQLTKADALVHAAPQICGAVPQAGAEDAPAVDNLIECTAAVIEAAKQHGLKRVVSLSFAYLYEAADGAAREGDRDAHDAEYAPMLRAETLVRESGLSGAIIRSGYIYGGHSSETAALADAIKGSQRLPNGARPASWIHEDDLAATFVALLESDEASAGIELLNAAAGAPLSPNDFSSALSDALGLSAPRFATGGFFSTLREKSLRDKLLEREIIIDSSALQRRIGWEPAHSSVESGLEASALVWRMQDAVDADDFYNDYEDEAAAAIASFAYDVALPEPVAETAAPVPQQEAEEAPVKAAAPPPSDGPTPWNEDEAKREERRRKALERKAKRAARQAGG